MPEEPAAAADTAASYLKHKAVIDKLSERDKKIAAINKKYQKASTLITTRPVVIIVFAHVVRTYVRPHFSKQNKFQVKTMFTTGEAVGLAEWILDDTCLVLWLNFIFYYNYKQLLWFNQVPVYEYFGK